MRIWALESRYEVCGMHGKFVIRWLVGNFWNLLSTCNYLPGLLPLCVSVFVPVVYFQSKVFSILVCCRLLVNWQAKLVCQLHGGSYVYSWKYLMQMLLTPRQAIYASIYMEDQSLAKDASMHTQHSIRFWRSEECIGPWRGPAWSYMFVFVMHASWCARSTFFRLAYAIDIYLAGICGWRVLQFIIGGSIVTFNLLEECGIMKEGPMIPKPSSSCEPIIHVYEGTCIIA